MGARAEAREKRKMTREERKAHRNHRMLEDMGAFEPRQERPRKRRPLECKTEAQGHYLLSMKSNQLTFGIGPAGTGKTFVCTRLAAELLESGEIQKILVTRPAVEAGGGLGFLPGTVDEKFAPYFAPFKQVLEDYFGRSHLENLMKSGKIEIQPLEYIRGLTFDNCFVILDEAQNTTPMQMKTFLTRLGEFSTVVINGDPSQKDIPGPCGLIDAVARLDDCPRVNVCEFTEEDIVRSGLVKDILIRYRNIQVRHEEHDGPDPESWEPEREPLIKGFGFKATPIGGWDRT